MCAAAAYASDSELWLTCTIVTRLCWPDLPNDKLELPPAIRAVFDAYNDHYHAAKAPRKLLWRPSLGSVEVELQFEDRELTLMVSPVQVPE